MKRIKQRYYSKDKLSKMHFVSDPDGYLFADRTYPTKIRPSDLPPSFVYGRFYGCYGYMDTRGITDMLYHPSKFSNHYLKDDCLMVAYGGKISLVPDPPKEPNGYVSYLDMYEGFDERFWGNEILEIVAGAIVFSDYDASEIIRQLKDKVTYMREHFKDEFVDFQFDVDAYIERECNELRSAKA